MHLHHSPFAGVDKLRRWRLPVILNNNREINMSFKTAFRSGLAALTVLLISNAAAAVEIYFKGQRVGADAKKGEPKRFTFAASGGEIAKKG